MKSIKKIKRLIITFYQTYKIIVEAEELDEETDEET